LLTWFFQGFVKRVYESSVGVADKEADTRRLRLLFEMKAPGVGDFRVYANFPPGRGAAKRMIETLGGKPVEAGRYSEESMRERAWELHKSGRNTVMLWGRKIMSRSTADYRKL
jgi:hypothetical protein